MKKNKNIFLLGALFFLFALVKYAFLSDQMPTIFIALEILSFMVVLFMVYYVLNFIETCKHGSEHTNMDKECIQRQLEIVKLKKMLRHYENDNKESEDEQLDSNILIKQLKQIADIDIEKYTTNVFNVIKEHFEIMAGIAYCSNSDNNYGAIKTMGLDEEWVVEPIQKGEGIHGQALADNKAIEIEEIPEDYFEVNSGTGGAAPKFIYMLPFIMEDGRGVLLELAVFKPLNIVSIWNQFITEA